MSRRSQVKRAARAKTRARERSRNDHRDGGHDGSAEWPGFRYGYGPTAPPPPPPGTWELLEEARAGLPWGLWAERTRPIPQETFHTEAEPVLVSWVLTAYEIGWQPTELIRFAHMRGKSEAADLVRLAVAAERRVRSGPTAQDAGWLQQWSAAGLPESSPGWVARWAATRESWLKALYRTAMVFGQLTVLDVLLPPPPGVRVSQPTVGRTMGEQTNPVLTRVRALLAKAESSEFESEALAFTAKAQELITKHALDQALLAAKADVGASPSIIRVPLDAPYLDAKALLLQTIAAESRCRSMFHLSLAMSSVIGFPAELEAVELLFTSLLVQAQRALAEAGAAAPPGSRVRSQSFRAAFLMGFTARIQERLAAANKAAFDGAKADSAAYLPVLRAQDKRIDEFVEERFTSQTSSPVRGGFDPQGYHHGVQAGDAAALVAGAVDG
ncbi:Protein of unknown function [Tessaracoccus bendigoensis DSM 12906]|uniref:DUF2786 domain-containing protein n=1 Tax=Tessaracoccus bendigoensis DSM 12906 TaxID=1123357 RepID=A0A1M6JC63_9ACTN|nr:DUF2786 domain-containing protein [Tessaracoccus bendigoensis]SHJ44271.1 Protein of unknown function [Tessaracoccus bendigoensis DSM 12906]